jgi:hypothetical protein
MEEVVRVTGAAGGQGGQGAGAHEKRGGPGLPGVSGMGPELVRRYEHEGEAGLEPRSLLDLCLGLNVTRELAGS